MPIEPMPDRNQCSVVSAPVLPPLQSTQADTQPGSFRSALPLAESLDDQIAFLYDQARYLHDLFTEFTVTHDYMTVFKPIQEPLYRLPSAAKVVQITLDEFSATMKCVSSFAIYSVAHSFIFVSCGQQKHETSSR